MMNRLRALAATAMRRARPYVPGEDMRRLGGRTFALILVQFSGFAILFVVGLLLGRWLGAAQLGAYTTAITIVTFAKCVATLGFVQLMVRAGGAYRETQDWAHLKGLLAFSRNAVLVACALAALLLALGFWLWAPDELAGANLVLFLALPLIPVLAITDTRSGLLVGLDRSVDGRLPDTIVRPGAYLLLLLGFALLLGTPPDADWAMGLRVGADIAALLVAALLVARHLPAEVRQARPLTDTKPWVRSLGYYLTIDVFYLVYLQIDILILAAFRPLEEVGIYRMAMSLVLITSVASLAGGMVLAPRVAGAWARGEHRSIQATIVGVTRLTFLGTIVLYVGVVAATPLVVLILGPSYEGLIWPVLVLGIGHVARGFLSGAPNLTLHTGGERDAAIGIVACAILNVVLNFLLVPRFGMMGAAVTSSLSLTALTLVYAIRGHQRTGLDSSALGWWGPRPGPKTP